MAWKRADEGWAVFSRRPPHGEQKALVEERAEQIVEWAADRGLSAAHLPDGGIGRLKRLRRASPDGATLSTWARHDDELPLEVAFAPLSSAHIADGRVISTPPTIEKKSDWKDALSVGALTRLRALSLNTQESAKGRARRGDAAPYPTVPSWFAASPLGGRLEALELYVDPHDLADALAVFDVLPNLQELVLWFSGLTTACFWCTRRGDLHLQTQGLGAEDDRMRRRWEFLLKTVLTPAARSKVRETQVTTVLHGVDPDRVREALAPYLEVEAVHVGGSLREL